MERLWTHSEAPWLGSPAPSDSTPFSPEPPKRCRILLNLSSLVFDSVYPNSQLFLSPLIIIVVAPPSPAVTEAVVAEGLDFPAIGEVGKKNLRMMIRLISQLLGNCGYF